MNLSPSVGENRIRLATEVRKMDADGSLGEVLRSGSFADSIREKIAASIESAIRKAAILKSMLPAGLEDAAVIQTVQFTGGPAGRLWLEMAGEVRLSAERFRAVAKELSH